jgi:radical SAM protein with 4Fe4S-binding SPASM domain
MNQISSTPGVARKGSDGRLPSSQAFDHLVYLRIFEGCNLHCKHCFIPSNPRRMSIEDIGRTPEILSSRIPEGSRVLIQWHGGEPTLMGVDFMKSAIDLLRKTGPKIDWRFGIQTNLMTFDAKWADLYHDEFGSEVGVSWDPKIRLLNRHALQSNPVFNTRFDAKLAQLVESGLTPYLVVTATRTLFESFPNPYDFFQHWIDRGVRHVHLERVTQTGYARDNWNEIGLTNAEYSSSMARWMRAYRTMLDSAGGPPALMVSPFDGMLDSAASLSAGQARSHGCWSGACDTRFHTIDADGYKGACTALTSETGNRNAPAALNLPRSLTTARELRTFNCGSCRFRPICSSGCLALSFDDGSGECSGGQKLFAQAERLAGGLK